MCCPHKLGQFICTGGWYLCGQFALFVKVITLLHQELTQECQTNAKDHGNDDIGGVVDIQIQPGEGDQASQQHGGNAELLVMKQDHRGGLKGGNGVSGGEREVMLGFNQKLDGHTEMLQLIIVGANAGSQGLEHTVADQ